MTKTENLECPEFEHVTVLLHETIVALDIKPDGKYLDCTTGGGGHSFEIAKRLNSGRLFCFDRDTSALKAAKIRLGDYSESVTFINANFADMADYGIVDIDGIVMDLGVSSHQLDTAERGFSFHEDAPLDMRMDASVSSDKNNENASAITAETIVNSYNEDELLRILYEYGEEKHARSIVKGILHERESSLIQTTGQLAEIIRSNVPLSYRNKKNPCRKTFQALRIEVNDELGSLSRGLESGFAALKSGGRLAVITFHSLEDRLVKKAFAELASGCDCPKELPLCVCKKSPKAISVTRKPIVPTQSEIENNRRSRSAKLRVIKKV
ncbi:MAG: 16S rRNA (cytosine(1402)-N(4))-methyltransferase RsmH [Oscillospiraceae bacterium]|nr:16S rRNA (cytosine(1402)-N(4))-methyltransferase RsmH [Oscillospiraceae bacterium]